MFAHTHSARPLQRMAHAMVRARSAPALSLGRGTNNLPESRTLKPRPVRLAVVDDDGVSRLLAVRFARDLGAVCTPFAHGAELLREAAHAPDGETPAARFDAVVTDYDMHPMDGRQLVTELRGEGFPGPIVVCTGDLSQQRRHQCMRVGAMAVLEKPVTRAVMLFVAQAGAAAATDAALRELALATTAREEGIRKRVQDAALAAAHEALRIGMESSNAAGTATAILERVHQEIDRVRASAVDEVAIIISRITTEASADARDAALEAAREAIRSAAVAAAMEAARVADTRHTAAHEAHLEDMAHAAASAAAAEVVRLTLRGVVLAAKGVTAAMPPSPNPQREPDERSPIEGNPSSQAHQSVPSTAAETSAAASISPPRVAHHASTRTVDDAAGPRSSWWCC